MPNHQHHKHLIIMGARTLRKARRINEPGDADSPSTSPGSCNRSRSCKEPKIIGRRKLTDVTCTKAINFVCLSKGKLEIESHEWVGVLQVGAHKNDSDGTGVAKLFTADDSTIRAVKHKGARESLRGPELGSRFLGINIAGLLGGNCTVCC